MKLFNFVTKIIGVIASIAGLANWVALADDKPTLPKYGKTAIPLRLDSTYLRKHDAPDFWQLIPFYSGNPGECGCSTVLSMSLNAIRVRSGLTTSDKLITNPEMVKKVVLPGLDWAQRMATGRGIDLNEVPPLLAEGFRVYGIAANTWKAEATHLEGKGPATLGELRAVFKLNEANKDDFILANFVQGTLVGDPEAMVGHFSMVGAYDSGTDRALILDVDREYMEPYWVKLSLLVDAMATQDKDSQNWRGYVRIFKNTK